MTDRERRRLWIALGVALAAVTLFRVLAIDAIADRSFFAKYIEFADALRSGTIPRDRIPDLSPGYLGTIALLRAIGLGVHGIRTLQIILLSGVAAIAARIAFKIRGDLAAIVAAILVLGSKAALVNATDIEPETFLLLFCAIGLALVAAPHPPFGHLLPASGEKGTELWGAGLAFGLAVTFRPVALLAALVLAVWLRKRAMPFVIGLIIPIVATLAVNRAMTGSVLLMDPGTVFYEGMNPNATGYAGVAPRIVKDIEQTIPGPDTMHVAYRVVAGRVMHRPLSREEANQFWSRKAFAFVREYPVRAIALVTRKVRLLISAHDAYDVPSMVLKDRALRGLWISWALLIPLAAAGIVRGTAPVVIYAMCAAVSPIAFFVTARHRNPLLIALAILGGIGVSTLIKRRAVLPAILIVLAAIALSIPGDLQREDDYLWTATFAVSDAMTHNARALAATWLPENVPPVGSDVLHQVALQELGRTTSPARSFSIAIALLDANDPTTANLVLQRLQSLRYRPFRRTRAVSSVAYYRAKALIKLHNPFEAQKQLARAREEAPGDADVLALSAFLDRDPQYAHQLDRLHDPFTRDWALARAAFSIGDEMTAQRLASRARAGIPDWPLPADLR